MSGRVVDRVPASFDAALEALARAARCDVAHASIARAREACGVRHYSEGSWSSDLARIGLVAGVRVRSVDLSVSEVVRGLADELFPLVRITEREGGVSCVTIVARAGSRVRVTVDDDPAVLTFDAVALAHWLGASDDRAVTWATGEPLTSLATAGSAGHGSHHAAMHPLKRLLSLVRLERDDLGVVVVYAAGIGLLSLATPLGVQFLVNTVAFGALLQPLVVLTLLVLSGLVLEGLLQALKAWSIERIQQRIFVRVALDIAFRLPRVRQNELDTQHAPELVNRFFDVVALQKGVAGLLSEGVAIVLSAIVGMVVLAFYHPFLLAFDVMLVIGIAIVVFVFGRRGIETSIDESEMKYAVAAWLEEAAAHRTTLALGDGPTYVGARAELLTRTWLDRRRNHWDILFRQLTSALTLRALASAALLGLGGWLVLARQLTLGQLVAAELVVGTVVAGFAKFGKAFENVYDLAAAADKLGHIVDLELDGDSGDELPRQSRGLDIALRGVGIARGDTSLVREVELHLNPGSRTVVYGGGGSGKSALVDVLAGIRSPRDGVFLVDDKPTTDLATPSLRSAIALVRDAEIFEGTLFENVAMGRPDVDRTRARNALAMVGLDAFVNTLPDGLDTHLPSHGHVLGGTAAILVTFARALAGSTRLLVVDGSFDGLDDVGRRVVWRAVSERPWTVVVTTARREILDLAETTYEIAEQRLTNATRAAIRLARPSMPHVAPAEEA